MAELTKIEFKSIPTIYVYGIELKSNMSEIATNNPIPAFWDNFFQNGINSLLDPYMDKAVADGYVGFMDNYNEQTGEFSYIIGVMLSENADINDDRIVLREKAPVTVGIGWIKGKDCGECCSNAHCLTEQAIKNEGYELDFDAFWCTEVYNCPRFTTPDVDGNITLDYWITCKK